MGCSGGAWCGGHVVRGWPDYINMLLMYKMNGYVVILAFLSTCELAEGFRTDTPTSADPGVV